MQATVWRRPSVLSSTLYSLKPYHTKGLVPENGLEPSRCHHRGILSPLCLPIPPLRHMKWFYFSSEPHNDVKGGVILNQEDPIILRCCYITFLIAFSIA